MSVSLLTDGIKHDESQWNTEGSVQHCEHTAPDGLRSGVPVTLVGGLQEGVEEENEENEEKEVKEEQFMHESET